MIKVLLVTTTIYSKEMVHNLNRLFNSIDYDDENIDIEHILLFQACDSFVDIKVPAKVNTLFQNNVVSLSKARNIMLAKTERKLDEYDFVAFPDDDCWYPNNNFREIIYYFMSNKLDYLITKYRYTNHDKVDFDKVACSCGLGEYLKYSSSITIFVTGKILNQVAYFDEKLGVGAKYIGGEDLDFSLRSYKLSKNRAFLNSFLLAHKDRNVANKVKYFEGSLYVFVKNSGGLKVSFYLLRKVFVGFYYALSGKMTVKELISIFKRVLIEQP